MKSWKKNYQFRKPTKGKKIAIKRLRIKFDRKKQSKKCSQIK